MDLKANVGTYLSDLKEEVSAFKQEYGERIISQVTINQILGGARGVKCLLCDTSTVSSIRGLIIRGIPIKELTERTPEEVLHLLLTGEFAEDPAAITKDLQSRSQVPEYIWKLMDAMPENTHPMNLFNTMILAMGGESKFRKKYNEGMNKEDYWEYTYEDMMDILARLPVIAAAIYRKCFNKGPCIDANPDLDWGTNFAHMLGIEDSTGDFARLMRLYLVLHCDHGGGNVSALATATVNSALSDLYYSLSAGLNGLAGPLHGLANQECLKWVLDTMEQFKGAPSQEQLAEYAEETLKSGRVIPGYGHAVLRIQDPRFAAFYEFGKKYCGDDPVFQTVQRVFETVPGILKKIEKISNPWPNVDAISGSLLYKYGLKEFDYYTVLFGLSRAMGVCAQAVMARGLGMPLVRPKAVTFDWLRLELMH
jgi:citrate synthase